MKAKTDKRSRRILRRYNAREREQLIKEYNRSGKSRREFCEERGIKLKTFHDWFRKIKRPVQGFAEVTVSEVYINEIRIELTNGVKVYLKAGKDMGTTGELVRRVAGC